MTWLVVTLIIGDPHSQMLPIEHWENTVCFDSDSGDIIKLSSELQDVCEAGQQLCESVQFEVHYGQFSTSALLSGIAAK